MIPNSEITLLMLQDAARAVLPKAQIHEVYPSDAGATSNEYRVTAQYHGHVLATAATTSWTSRARGDARRALLDALVALRRAPVARDPFAALPLPG